MQKRKTSILWLSAWGLLLPLFAFGDNRAPVAPAAPAAAAAPAADADEHLAVDHLETLRTRRAAQQRARDAERLRALEANPEALEAEIRHLEAVEAANKLRAEETRTTEARTNAAPNRARRDVKNWEDLKKIIANAELKNDSGPGKNYSVSWHLEGSVPKKCVDVEHLEGGPNKLVETYTLATRPRIADLDGTPPFSGYRIQTSNAAEECVAKFKADGERCNKDNCLQMKDFAKKITDLAKGPKIGFYACEDEDDHCKIAYYNGGKAEGDIARVADLGAYNEAKRKLDSRTKALATGLRLWKVKHGCYDKNTDGLKKLFSEISELKKISSLKDEDFKSYARRGLRAQIASLKTDASNKKISELRDVARAATSFYNAYLSSSGRTGLPDPDLDSMRREVLGLYRTMEYRILDDDSAFNNPDAAKSNAEDIIHQALTLDPMDEGIRAMFRNELEQGINVDITVLKLSRKDAAFKQALESGDPNRIARAWQSRMKGLGGAAKYYQKLQMAQMRACAKGGRGGSRRGAPVDGLEDDGLYVPGGDSEDDEDLPTFNSRCEAATDNLRRIWERKTEADQNATQSTPSPQIVQQLAQGINGGTNVPNATITPGQNGYNPALAYALQIPGNFQQSFLDSLAPRLTPSTALGTGQICFAGGAGTIANCGTTTTGTMLPPALPIRTLATQ